MKPSNPMKYTPEGRTMIFMSSGREFVVIDDFSQLTENALAINRLRLKGIASFMLAGRGFVVLEHIGDKPIC
jgi:hypothetical protein